MCERIGRLKERYPNANKHYSIEVKPDEKQDKAIDVIWKRTPLKRKSTEDVYLIRTSLSQTDEKTLWTIYNTLTEIEATFRVLKTDLSLRPVFHKTDKNVESHLFLRSSCISGCSKHTLSVKAERNYKRLEKHRSDNEYPKKGNNNNEE